MWSHLTRKYSRLILSHHRVVIGCSLIILLGVLVMIFGSVYSKHLNSDTSLNVSQVLSWDEYVSVKDIYVARLLKNDPLVVLASLREDIKKDSRLAHSCHVIVHELGHAAYETYGSFSDAMRYQDELCNSGYLHGIIESVFSETKDLTTTISTICTASTTSKYKRYQCYHGVGHGVMFFTENDLPASLKLCESYNDIFAVSSCVNGVFMENFNVDQGAHISKYIDEHNPMYPCTVQAIAYKADCYLYPAVYYLYIHKNDYKGALKACESAEAPYRLTCATGVGSQAIKDNINNPRVAERLCMSNRLYQIQPCITGMSMLYVNHFGSTTPAVAMCQELLFFNKGTCLRAVEAQRELFF